MGGASLPRGREHSRWWRGGPGKSNRAGPTAATPAPASRVMLTWDATNNVGIPFAWTSPGLSTAEENTLDALDATQTATRLYFLPGRRPNEIDTAGAGLDRSPPRVLCNIRDS